MKHIFLALIPLTLIILACSKQEDDYEPVSCSAAESDRIPVGANVAADFNVSNITATGNITSSSCSGIPVSSGTFTVNAQRASNTLTLSDSDGSIMSTAISGTTLAQVSDTAAAGDCILSITYNGSLDTGTNEILLDSVLTLTQNSEGACQGLLNTRFNKVGMKDIVIE